MKILQCHERSAQPLLVPKMERTPLKKGRKKGCELILEDTYCTCRRKRGMLASKPLRDGKPQAHDSDNKVIDKFKLMIN